MLWTCTNWSRWNLFLLSLLLLTDPILRLYSTANLVWKGVFIISFFLSFFLSILILNFDVNYLIKGPLMAQKLREKDRNMNKYPFLNYPQVFFFYIDLFYYFFFIIYFLKIYILKGGYHSFYYQYKNFKVFKSF
jgi:hypothetical protein